MSSKVALEKRRPGSVISKCRVRRRDASEKQGLATAKGLGESVHRESADKLVRRDRHGFQRPGGLVSELRNQVQQWLLLEEPEDAARRMFVHFGKETMLMKRGG